MSAFYVLWSNRNGQHHWSGPWATAAAARAVLYQVIDHSNAVVVKKIPQPHQPPVGSSS